MGALCSVQIILRFTPKPPLGSPIPAAECHEGCTPSLSIVVLTATEGHQSQQAKKKRRSEQELIFEVISRGRFSKCNKCLNSKIRFRLKQLSLGSGRSLVVGVMANQLQHARSTNMKAKLALLFLHGLDSQNRQIVPSH